MGGAGSQRVSGPIAMPFIEGRKMRSVELPNFIQHIGAQGVTTATESSVQREQLTRHLNAFLECQRFKDVATNGLQVAGRERIANIVVGVTANKALIDAAIEAKAGRGYRPSRTVLEGRQPGAGRLSTRSVSRRCWRTTSILRLSPAAGCARGGWQQRSSGPPVWLSPTGTCGEAGLVMLGQLG